MPFELKDHHQIPFGTSNARVVSIAASPTGEHVTALSSVGEMYLLYPGTCHDEMWVDQSVGEMQLDDRVLPPPLLFWFAPDPHPYPVFCLTY